MGTELRFLGRAANTLKYQSHFSSPQRSVLSEQTQMHPQILQPRGREWYMGNKWRIGSKLTLRADPFKRQGKGRKIQGEDAWRAGTAFEESNSLGQFWKTEVTREIWVKSNYEYIISIIQNRQLRYILNKTREHQTWTHPCFNRQWWRFCNSTPAGKKLSCWVIWADGDIQDAVGSTYSCPQGVPFHSPVRTIQTPRSGQFQRIYLHQVSRLCFWSNSISLDEYYTWTLFWRC